MFQYKWLRLHLITARVRSTREGNVFTLLVRPRGRGYQVTVSGPRSLPGGGEGWVHRYPLPYQDRVPIPSQEQDRVPTPLLARTPFPVHPHWTRHAMERICLLRSCRSTVLFRDSLLIPPSPARCGLTNKLKILSSLILWMWAVKMRQGGILVQAFLWGKGKPSPFPYIFCRIPILLQNGFATLIST